MGQVFSGTFRNEHWDYGTGTSNQEERIVGQVFPGTFRNEHWHYGTSNREKG